MYQHMSSKQLKKSARARLSANQGICVGATASYLGIIAAVYVMTALTIGVSSSVTIIIQSLCGLMISVLSGILSAGYQYMFLKLYCGRKIQVSDLFYGFQYKSGIFFVISLILALLSTFIDLPTDYFTNAYMLEMSYMDLTYLGIFSTIALCLTTYIKLAYSQAYYLALDYPEESALSLMRMSRHFMKGHKGRLFYIYASFIPLLLLCILSLGIGFLWVLPYMQAVLTEFYLDIATHKS